MPERDARFGLDLFHAELSPKRYLQRKDSEALSVLTLIMSFHITGSSSVPE